MLIMDLAMCFDVILQDVHSVVGQNSKLTNGNLLFAHMQGYTCAMPLDPLRGSLLEEQPGIPQGPASLLGQFGYNNFDS